MTDCYSTSTTIVTPMTADTSDNLQTMLQEGRSVSPDVTAASENNTISSKTEPTTLSKQETMAALISAMAQSLVFTWSMTVVKRVIVIILLLADVKVSKIIELTGASNGTVYHWRNELNGITSVEEVSTFLVSRPNQKKESTGKLVTIEEQILEGLEKNDFHSLRQVADWLKNTFNVTSCLSNTSEFLHNHGYRKLKSGSLPAKADPKKQRKCYDEILRPLMRRAREGKDLLFFADASHFVIGGEFAGSIWSRTRRFVKTLSGRSRYNVLGAIDYVSKKVLTVTNSTEDKEKYITSKQVLELLDKIAAYASAAGLPAFVVLDNARYQKCDLVQKYAAKLRITLIYLPSYSPNLNLIERFWKFVKSELRTQHFTDFLGFRNRIDEIIASSTDTNRDKVASLIRESVQLFDDLEPVTDVTYRKARKEEPEAAA